MAVVILGKYVLYLPISTFPISLINDHFSGPNFSKAQAVQLIQRLSVEERRIFLKELKKVVPAPQTCSVDCQLIVQVDSRQSRSDKPTPGELRQLAYHNSLPFIGFGFLDNFIMIVAGEYIDLTLGMKLGISTMVSFKSSKILAWLLFRQLQPWATPSRTWWGLGAPGNRITCYLMLNWKIWIIWPDCIFRYVESWAEKLGATPPNLSSEQLEMTR